MRVTLLGLWLFPAIIAVHLSFYRFCLVWAAYSGLVAHFLSLCINKPRVAKTMPKRVGRFTVACGVSPGRLRQFDMTLIEPTACLSAARTSLRATAFQHICSSHKVSVALGVCYILVVSEVFGLAPVLRFLRLPPELSCSCCCGMDCFLAV